MTTKYIPNPFTAGQLPKNGGQGWLRVRDESAVNKTFFLPMYLRVETYPGTEANRDYFVIQEGALKGKKASVSFEEFYTNCWFGYWCDTERRSRLRTDISHTGPCTVRYQKVAATTKKPGGGTYNATTERTMLSVGTGTGKSFQAKFRNVDVIHQFDLLKPGTYSIRIPDYEHVKKGRKYLNETTLATTWFPIGEPLYLDDPSTAGVNEKGKFNRYFHTGNGSAGCLTVRDRSKWNQIVNFMALCRSDDQNVGFLEVIAASK